MKIACLSGKGGAGKTFIAVNLAATIGKCTYIDCDVEEPNGKIFFKPQNIESKDVYTLLPEFNPQKCIGCRKCVDFCRFNALVYIKNKPIVFPEICHNCGGCMLVCDNKAITEVNKSIGIIEKGNHGKTTVVSGVLNIGEASGVPVIREALKEEGEIIILDCPPGSACSVMETVMDADYCVLVAEATAFGFHNVKMVHELTTILDKPCGVIINKKTETYKPLQDYCVEKNITILDEIEFNHNIGKKIANGEIVSETILEEKNRFTNIINKIGGCL